MEKIKSVFLLAIMTGLLVLMGRWLGGTGGMILAFGFAVVMNFSAYWFSDRIALSMAGAQPVTQQEAPELYQIVQRVAAAAQIPMPRVYIIDAPQPNAFATGRDPEHSAIAVTTGILRVLEWDELAGVLAHELGHVKNRDILVSSVAATLAGAVTMIAEMGRWGLLFGGFGGRNDEEHGGYGGLGGILMLFIAPFAAMIIQFAIARTREYDADTTGAHLLGDPMPLARALAKISRGNEVMPPMDVNPSTASLFIVNPLRGMSLANLFSTHPPIEERIRRLQAMAGTSARGRRAA